MIFQPAGLSQTPNYNQELTVFYCEYKYKNDTHQKSNAVNKQCSDTVCTKYITKSKFFFIITSKFRLKYIVLVEYKLYYYYYFSNCYKSKGITNKQTNKQTNKK